MFYCTLLNKNYFLLYLLKSLLAPGIVDFGPCANTKGGGRRGLSRFDLTVGRFFFLPFGKMSSGWETVEIN